MRNWFRSLFQQIISRAALKLIETVTLSLTALIIGGVGTSIAWQNFEKLLTPYKWLLITASVLFVITIVVFVILRFNQYIPNIPKIKSKLHFTDRHLFYRYITREQIQFMEKIRAKANTDFSTYIFKFHWGGSKFDIRSGKTEHKLSLLPQKGPFQRVELDFNRLVHKGEEIEIELYFELQDREHRAPTLLNQAIHSPCNKLCFEIEIPVHLGINYVRKQRYSTEENIEDLDITHLDSNGKMKWEVVKPKLLYTYEIFWIFPQNNSSKLATK
jgi:hypothetical protein